MVKKRIYEWVCPLCNESFKIWSCCKDKAERAMTEVHAFAGCRDDYLEEARRIGPIARKIQGEQA